MWSKQNPTGARKYTKPSLDPSQHNQHNGQRGVGHPQSYSPIHNLPERNPFFTGREDVLTNISHSLKSNKQVAIKQAISGLGGIGKTHTAIEFCYRHFDNYKFIFWVNSESEVSFNKSYFDIVDLLNLAPNNQPLNAEQAIALVRRWLSNNSHWLMVLDNLDDYQTFSKDSSFNLYLPSYHQGHILITTRSHNLGNFAKTIKLDKMDNSTGALFLLRRTGLLQDYHSLDLANEEHKKLAQQIVKEMDGLPLALDQAAAYIQNTNSKIDTSSLSRYLSLYQDARHSAKLRDKRGKHTYDHVSVTATFQLAFDKVKDKSPIAADLLSACSFLPPDSIPQEIFTIAGQHLGDNLASLVDDELAWDEVIELLLSYSLIDRDSNNNSLSIHKLVQAVTRDLIPDKTKDSLLVCLIKRLDLLSPEDPEDTKTWLQYQRILLSALGLANWKAKKKSSTNPDIFLFKQATRLFFQVGLYCVTQALFLQALDCYFISLEVEKNIFGKDSPGIATTLNNIGEAYRHLGNYEEALNYYQQALSIYKSSLGDLHHKITLPLNNIAAVYMSQGKYKEGLDLFQQVLSLDKTTLGEYNPKTAQTINNIGAALYIQGKHKQALAYFLKASSINRATLPPFHLDLACTLNNIGAVYESEGAYKQALDYYEQALSIKKALLSNTHPSIADTLNNIAVIYHNQGSYQQALAYSQEALSIYESSLGKLHPDTANALLNVAIVCDKQEKYEQALNYSQEALSIYKFSLGDLHPNIAKALDTIGIIHCSQGKYKEGLAYYNSALSIKKASLGENHFSIVNTLNNIAGTYFFQKNFRQALEYNEQTLSIYKTLFGKYHPSTANSLNNIAGSYCGLGKYELAEKTFLEALEIKEKTLGKNHLSTAETLANLALLYSTISKELEAANHYQQALLIYDQFLPNNHSDVVKLLKSYSKILLKLNRNDEAQILLDRLK